jgi:hypothetical protein
MSVMFVLYVQYRTAMVTGTMEVGIKVWRGLLRSKMAVRGEWMSDEALDDKNEGTSIKNVFLHKNRHSDKKRGPERVGA